MTYKQRVGVFEAYNRAKNGPRVEENDWDYKIIPGNAKKLKEKYGIKIDKKTIVPTDEELINNLFRAGLELLVETGIYCMDTGRVIKYTEEEVLTAVKAAPKQVILGEGKDAVILKGRKYNDSAPPIIQGGPTGAPVAEEQFVAMHQAYAKEPLIDTIVDGVLQTINGEDPTPGSPWEIAAVKSEAMMVRLAQTRAGRPGMAL
jgi:methylamine--corrinoid protein Co-methyltransferase